MNKEEKIDLRFELPLQAKRLKSKEKVVEYLVKLGCAEAEVLREWEAAFPRQEKKLPSRNNSATIIMAGIFVSLLSLIASIFMNQMLWYGIGAGAIVAACGSVLFYQSK